MTRCRPLPLAALLAALACPQPTAPPDAGGADDNDADADADVDGGDDPDVARDGGVDADDDAGVDDDDDAGVLAPLPSLRDHRDRLLDSLGDSPDRCVRWAAFDEVQRGVFLTITDLLGRRSYLRDGPAAGARSGVELEMALDHVTRLWAVNGAEPDGCVRCCGGGEFNRLYFSADDALLQALRTGVGLPAWRDSSDVAGPHEPFSKSLETNAGQPRGQLHFWASDGEAVALARPGVVGVVDAHIVEIDLDYNVIHESNPECSYSGQPGRVRYEEVWSVEEAFGAAAFDYVPGGC